MQSTHRYGAGRLVTAQRVGWLPGAALRSYRAFSEGYSDALWANARFADGLLEAGKTLVEGARRQRTVATVACVDLFWAPFRGYGREASSDEFGEDGMHKGSDNREEDRMLALADGTSVPVREIKPGDAPALQRLFDRLSERSVQLRYFGPMKELSDEKARHFAEVDGVNRCALVALDPEDEEEIVAVVRYDREGDTKSAEYAALVEDRLQGKGLGLGLTRALIESARERGVENFEALVLPQNRNMIHLLRSLDLPERVRWENGVKRFTINLFPEKANGHSSKT